MVDWDYFDKFDGICERFLPVSGEGENKATQIVTAVNKLIYKYYNDGDVFDNTYTLIGWCNDLSSYANWLYKYTDQKNTLDRIKTAREEDDYEKLLKDLADNLLVLGKLDAQAEEPKTESIYDCDGPFRFEEYTEDDEEWG